MPLQDGYTDVDVQLAEVNAWLHDEKEAQVQV